MSVRGKVPSPGGVTVSVRIRRLRGPEETGALEAGAAWVGGRARDARRARDGRATRVDRSACNPPCSWRIRAEARSSGRRRRACGRDFGARKDDVASRTPVSGCRMDRASEELRSRWLPPAPAPGGKPLGRRVFGARPAERRTGRAGVPVVRRECAEAGGPSRSPRRSAGRSGVRASLGDGSRSTPAAGPGRPVTMVRPSPRRRAGARSRGRSHPGPSAHRPTPGVEKRGRCASAAPALEPLAEPGVSPAAAAPPSPAGGAAPSAGAPPRARRPCCGSAPAAAPSPAASQGRPRTAGRRASRASA